MTQFHENILAEPQRRVLRTLGPFATKHGYYLAGGTAVALRLGHRESIDFDFFALDPTLHGAALRDELTVLLPGLRTSQASDGTFNGVADGVKVSYFRYKYPLLDTPDHWAEYDVDVAGLRDLSAMKLSAIAQRGAKKDFIDLHTMLATGMTLSAMFSGYRKRFKAIDLMPVRMGLVYFDDAEKQEMPVMNIPADWAKMKRISLPRLARSVVEDDDSTVASWSMLVAVMLVRRWLRSVHPVIVRRFPCGRFMPSN